ncbi:MAG TPA: hypothetical protein VHC90_02840 [Bryobacteraceae bacterium]|nr:hypothetical protein [Bryobacteraceae bacterium]
MPLSDRKLAANRINATKPRRHSRRRSFLSGAILLPHESSSRFAALFDSFTAEYNPQDSIERILVEKMTVAHWRLLRIWSLETTGLADETRRQREAHPTENPPTHTLRALHAISDTHRHSDLLGRHERRYDREFYNALRALKQHREQKMEKNSLVATELNESKEPAPREIPPVATDSHHLATPEPPQPK